MFTFKDLQAAITLLTIFPAGSAKPAPTAVRCFGLVGLLIGAVIWAADRIFSLLFDGLLTAALLLAANLAVTGGIHLEGLIDTCDGLFSRRERAQTLAIMKDSHLGAFGAVGAIMLLLIKFAALAGIGGPIRPWAVLFFPLAGRLAMAQAICLFGYARLEGGMGQIYARAGRRDLLSAAAAALIAVASVFWIFRPPAALVGSLLLCGGAAAAGSYFWALSIAAKLGGLTGDVYGAVNEAAEVLFLITAAAVRPGTM